MSRDTEPLTLKAGRLSDAECARLYEYRLPARKQDLRKTGKSRRVNRRKGSWGYNDPTARRAISRVMHTETSEGW